MMANQSPKLSLTNSYWPDLDQRSVLNPATLAREQEVLTGLYLCSISKSTSLETHRLRVVGRQDSPQWTIRI